MVRLIKRYDSRKLYDTEESRYVSLEEIAAWVRDGQEIRVVDNTSADDVTAHTLTQVILDESRRGASTPPSALLHDLIRRGNEVVSSGVQQFHNGVDRVLQASVDKLGPIRRAREETERLRQRLDELEASLARIEDQPAGAEPDPADSPTHETAAEETTP